MDKLLMSDFSEHGVLEKIINRQINYILFYLW